MLGGKYNLSPLALRKALAKPIVAAANAARDRRDWPNAARLYAQAASRRPDRPELLVQQGNCLKEAGHYARAYAAYDAAFRTLPTADNALQMGHLLKITGNLCAAKHYFREAARLGDPSAGAELASWHLLLPARFSAFASSAADARDGGAMAPNSASSFAPVLRLLCWCEQDFTDAARLRNAAHALQAEGFTQGATALLGLARLWSSAGTAEDADTAIDALIAVLIHDSSAPIPPCAPDDAAAPILATDQTLNDAVTPISTLRAALTHPDTAAIARAFTTLDATIAPGAAPRVSFGTTQAAMAVQIGRVVFNGLCHYRQAIQPLAGGTLGSPLLLHTAFALPLPAHPGAPHILLQHLSIRLARQADIQDTRLLQRLALLLGRTARMQPLLNLLQALLDLRLTDTVNSLIGMVLTTDHASASFLHIAAQILKKSGQVETALTLQRRLVNISPVASNRFELALQERACGHYDRAAQLLRECIAEGKSEISESRLYDALLSVLSEISDPASVVAELRTDPAANSLLASKLRTRLYLHAVDYDDARRRFANGLTMTDLAPEIATEYLPAATGTLSDAADDIPLEDRPDLRPDLRIDMLQPGWETRRDRLGDYNILRGVSAIRCYASAQHPIASLRLRLDGRTIARVDATQRQPDPQDPRRHRAAFNIWHDFTAYPRGFHELEVVAETQSGYEEPRAALVCIEDPLPFTRFTESNAALPQPPGTQPLQEWIESLPSVTRLSDRHFLTMPRKILVMRADQLGDVATSVPAMQRLRTLLPDAEMVALVTPNNETLVRGLGIFSDVVTADLRYDHISKRRAIPLAQQIALREKLHAMHFDTAIDLSPGMESRALLRLSGAAQLIGFKPREFPYLTFGIESSSHDPVNGREGASHATMVLALVEAFGGILRHKLAPVLSPDATASLDRFGIGDNQPFVLLHAGARLLIKRWPVDHYLRLAALVLERTGLNVVMLSDDPHHISDADTAFLPADRFRFVPGHVAYAELETLVTRCTVFVGNDTGPKHLAALRGTKVVSVHMGQVNWDEWGQEGEGIIISRRVPCNGCGIEDAEDCGQDLSCLYRITPEEVADAVIKLL